MKPKKVVLYFVLLVTSYSYLFVILLLNMSKQLSLDKILMQIWRMLPVSFRGTYERG